MGVRQVWVWVYNGYGYGHTVRTKTGVRTSVQWKPYCDTHYTCGNQLLKPLKMAGTVAGYNGFIRCNQRFFEQINCKCEFSEDNHEECVREDEIVE